MRYNIGKSKAAQPKACVDEVTAGFQSPKLIIYFSPVDHFEEYTRLIYEKFPKSICIGSTTKVALSRTEGDLQGLLAVGIESGIKCSAGVLKDVDKYPIKHVDEVKRCVQEIGTTHNTMCLEMTTALLCAEESVLSTLNSVLLEKGIPVFGGSAGDLGTAINTMVALNGRVREKSAVFVLIHNEGGGIHFYRENIYEPITGRILLATKVDITKRQVMEFNNKPALSVYASELGVSEKEAVKFFDTNPLGRVVGDETFITANCNADPDKSVHYHARIYENSQVYVLGPADYKKIISNTLGKIKRECPNPSFAIICNCLARTMLFDSQGYLQEYAKQIGNTVGDYVGFSGYGEQLGQHHFNQTFAACIFD